MKKLFTIMALATLGTLTGCTTSTPTVDESKKTVTDQAVNVAKTVAAGAATKKIKDVTSKKK